MHRVSQGFLQAALLAAILLTSSLASAGRVILNNDEWTFTELGFASAPVSTTRFAQNLAAYMNADGGACNLLVYSSNFGVTGSSFKGALNAAGCSVTYDGSAMSVASLSNYDGVLLAGNGYSDAATLAAYVALGGSVYVAGGTGIANEDTVWDALTHPLGLDLGESYNGLYGTYAVLAADPLLDGVTELFFINGNSVALYGPGSTARIIASVDGNGILGVYDNGVLLNPPVRSQVAPVPEPATLALLSLGIVALRARRGRSASA